jgi:hypothetical protein
MIEVLKKILYPFLRRSEYPIFLSEFR